MLLHTMAACKVDPCLANLWPSWILVLRISILDVGAFALDQMQAQNNYLNFFYQPLLVPTCLHAVLPTITVSINCVGVEVTGELLPSNGNLSSCGK